MGVRVPSRELDPPLGWVSVHGLLDDPLKNSNEDFKKISHSNLSLYCVKNKKKVLVHCTE